MKNKEIKQKEAVQRQEDYNKLTLSQKVTKLDLMFGGGKGAAKERAKLASKIEFAKQIDQVQIKAVNSDKKSYQKPKKS